MGQFLSLGMKGPEVRAVQDVLNFHLRRAAPLRVDGVFGPKTRQRVIDFQKVNNLKADGIVGPKTSAELFEITEVPLPLLFLPTLHLTPPQFPSTPGIQPPPAFPTLPWPGPPAPLPIPFLNLSTLSLNPGGSTLLPSLSLQQPSVLGLKITVPTRKDPSDPFVASRQSIVELIDNLPVNSKFKVFLISKVPNPITKITAPPTGFDWGASPIFDPLDPKGFGVKGNAQFTIRVTDGGNGVPNMVFGAWGDGKFFLNFDTKSGQSRPTVQAEGQLFLGLKGVF